MNYYQTQYDGKQFTGNVPVDVKKCHTNMTVNQAG